MAFFPVSSATATPSATLVTAVPSTVTAASASLAAGMSLTWVTVLSTVAVYSVVEAAKSGASVSAVLKSEPSVLVDAVRAESVASPDFGVPLSVTQALALAPTAVRTRTRYSVPLSRPEIVLRGRPRVGLAPADGHPRRGGIAARRRVVGHRVRGRRRVVHIMVPGERAGRACRRVP